MKVSLLVVFDIPPHRNHTAEVAAIVAGCVERLLRANTEAATEIKVSLFTPPAPAKSHPFPTP